MHTGGQHQQHQHAPAAGDVLEHLARRTGGVQQFAPAQFAGQGGLVVAERRFCGFHTYLYVCTLKKYV